MSRVPIPSSEHSVALNGTSDYLDAGTLSDVQKASGFTFAGVVKVDAFTGTYGPIITRGGNANGGFAFAIQTSTKQARIFRNGGSLSTLIDYVWPLNKWVHFAFRWSSVGLTVYIDGEEVYAETNFPITDPASDLGLRFGGWEGFSHYFDGNMGPVAYYNVSATDEQMKQISKGNFHYIKPKRFWRMNEGSGSTTTEVVENTTASLESTAGWSPQTPAKPVKMADDLRFSVYQDGNSDTDIDFGDVLDMGTNDLTMACLFKADKPGNTASTLMGKTFYGAAENRYYISWAESTGRITAALVSNGSTLSVTPSPTKVVTDGKWHKAVAVWDRDGDLTVYVDNRDESASSDISSVEADDIDSTHSFRIGSSTASQSRHQGNIADCAWEARVWTDNEIDAFFNHTAIPATAIKWTWRNPDNTITSGITDDSGTYSGSVGAANIFRPIHPANRGPLLSDVQRYSMYFDGVNDDVDFDDVFDFDDNDATVAVRAKIMERPSSGEATLLGKTNTGSSNGRWRLSMNTSGKLIIAYDGGVGVVVTSQNAWDIGEWIDIVAKWDRDGNATLHVNKIVDASGDISSEAGDLNNVLDFRLGSNSGANRFKGWLADVVIDIGTLWSDLQIENYSNGIIPDGYDEYFDFATPDNDGTTVTGVNGTSGTRSGAVFTTDHPANRGLIDKPYISLNNDGNTNQHFDVLDSVLPASIEPPFTIEVIFAFRTPPDGSWAMLSKGNFNTQPSFGIWGGSVNNFRVRFRDSVGTNEAVCTPDFIQKTFESGKPMSIVGVIDSTDIIGYLNGIKAGDVSASAVGDFNDNPVDLVIGGFSYTALYENVDIYEVRLWNKARSQKEIIKTLWPGSVDAGNPDLLALYEVKDESDYGDLIDSSPNKYHGVLTNAVAGGRRQWAGRRKKVNPTIDDINWLGTYIAENITGVVDGGDVSSVTDESGNGHDMSTAVTNDPTYHEGVINGKAVVRFSDADDAFFSATRTEIMDLDAGFSAFWVFNSSDATTNCGLGGLWGGAGNRAWAMLLNGAATISAGTISIRNAGDTANYNADTTTDLTDGNDHFVLVNFDRKKNLLTISVDGKLEDTVRVTDFDTSITSNLFWGSYTDGTVVGDADHAEFRYGPTLTSEEIEAVNNYVSETYAIN